MLLTAEPLGNPTCPNGCENLMSRETEGSTSVMESLDNGVMPRKVERLRDIEDLRHDHATINDDKDKVV